MHYRKPWHSGLPSVCESVSHAYISSNAIDMLCSRYFSKMQRTIIAFSGSMQNAQIDILSNLSSNRTIALQSRSFLSYVCFDWILGLVWWLIVKAKSKSSYSLTWLALSVYFKQSAGEGTCKPISCKIGRTGSKWGEGDSQHASWWSGATKSRFH